MTLSRHSQIEDLVTLLSLRRALRRERALRQQAYWRLTNVVLNLPGTGRQMTLPTPGQPRAA